MVESKLKINMIELAQRLGLAPASLVKMGWGARTRLVRMPIKAPSPLVGEGWGEGAGHRYSSIKAPARLAGAGWRDKAGRINTTEKAPSPLVGEGWGEGDLQPKKKPAPVFLHAPQTPIKGEIISVFHNLYTSKK